MSKRKILAGVLRTLMVLSMVAAAFGLLYQIWAGYTAPPGESFNAAHLGMAITWTGIVMTGVFTPLWLWADE